jgi:hypothetical protein
LTTGASSPLKTLTFVNLDFYNQNETGISTFTSFDCWEQVQLTDIDPNLRTVLMTTPYGMVVTGQAQNVRTGGFRTLLGLIQTTEGPVGGPANAVRSYAVRPSNNSVPVTTYFVFD